MQQENIAVRGKTHYLWNSIPIDIFQRIEVTCFLDFLYIKIFFKYIDDILGIKGKDFPGFINVTFTQTV